MVGVEGGCFSPGRGRDGSHVCGDVFFALGEADEDEPVGEQ